MPAREQQRILITRRELFCLTIRLVTVDWSNCVNHELREQVSACSDYSLARRQTIRIFRFANRATRLENLRATRIVNSAVDATASKQRRVGGIDDRVHVLASDIAHYHQHAPVEK
jgi:hypothetical protein